MWILGLNGFNARKSCDPNEWRDKIYIGKANQLGSCNHLLAGLRRVFFIPSLQRLYTVKFWLCSYVTGDHHTFWETTHLPLPKPTLTLTSHLGQNVGLGEGQVGSFPATCNDPRFNKRNNILHVQHTFWYISLPSLHFDVKFHKATFS